MSCHVMSCRREESSGVEQGRAEQREASNRIESNRADVEAVSSSTELEDRSSGYE